MEEIKDDNQEEVMTGKKDIEKIKQLNETQKLQI